MINNTNDEREKREVGMGGDKHHKSGRQRSKHKQPNRH
jgi:hypothetical protein